MNILDSLGTPWVAALVALVTTLSGELFGKWINKDSSPPNVTVSGDARVGDLQIGHRWTTVHHHHNTGAADRAVPSSSTDDSNATLIAVTLGVMVAGSATAVAMARYWQAFELVVAGLIGISLFTSAALWRQWPTRLSARIGLRALIIGIGAALLWAVSVIPTGLPGVHDLAYLERHTRRLGFSAAMSSALQVLGMQGFFAYLYRRVGLVGLSVALVLLCCKAWGAALMAPTHQGWRLALGRRLTGHIPFGWGQFIGLLLMGGLCVSLIHPTTLGWLLRSM